VIRPLWVLGRRDFACRAPVSRLFSFLSSLFSSLFSGLGPAALAPVLALFLCGAALSWLSCAQVADAPRSPVDYVREIRPILEEHCYQCHGGEVRAPSGRLRLDTRQAASKGGRSGEPAIVPGKSAASPLVLSITGGERDVWRVMPPEGYPAPTRAEIRLIERWVDEGARWPESE
jgi:mono/diheme cytochrome c family protein